ncbi:hypothetical protein T261_1566 [Streptomyces lydicus]|nr:hypothetical protein T261_1566 [Streptomyces lydicus]
MPEEPPELTPAAATALLEFLLDAHNKLQTQHPTAARPADASATEPVHHTDHAR